MTADGQVSHGCCGSQRPREVYQGIKPRGRSFRNEELVELIGRAISAGESHDYEGPPKPVSRCGIQAPEAELKQHAQHAVHGQVP